MYYTGILQLSLIPVVFAWKHVITMMMIKMGNHDKGKHFLCRLKTHILLVQPVYNNVLSVSVITVNTACFLERPLPVPLLSVQVIIICDNLTLCWLLSFFFGLFVCFYTWIYNSVSQTTDRQKGDTKQSWSRAAAVCLSWYVSRNSVTVPSGVDRTNCQYLSLLLTSAFTRVNVFVIMVWFQACLYYMPKHPW